MDPTSEEGSPSPQNPPGWDSELVAKVASRFPELDQQELKAELAVTVLALQRNPPAGIRDRKAYLAQSLFNRATSLVRELRRRQKHEISTPFDIESPEPSVDSELCTSQSEARLESEQLRRRLDSESYTFLQVLAHFDGNQSQAAQFLGTHRNTVARRLRSIRRRLECPIQNVSGRLHLADKERKELERRMLDQETRGRDVFKARLILAVNSGKSYSQIERELNTTAPTILRWKHRFRGIGLMASKLDTAIENRKRARGSPL